MGRGRESGLSRLRGRTRGVHEVDSAPLDRAGRVMEKRDL